MANRIENVASGLDDISRSIEVDVQGTAICFENIPVVELNLILDITLILPSCI